MPRSSASAPPGAHTAGPAETRADLGALRPDLVGGYDAELPGARAAVLARLIGAVQREQLPGLVAREQGAATFGDGTVVGYPVEAAAMFAPGAPGLGVTVTRPAGNDTRGQPDHGRDGDARHGVRTQPDHGRDGDAGNGVLAQTCGPDGDAGNGVWTGLGSRRHGDGGAGRGEHVDDPGALARLLWPGSSLAGEIDNSVANLALARAARPATPRLPEPGSPDALGRLEQLLTDGHPLHPCCRTRTGMTVADVLAYAPEHSPVIRLRRLEVPEGRWYGTAEPVLYAHPWQADRLRTQYPWLRDAGETGPARPLMSLRTVAPLDGGPHIKTAVDIQMTSAVRTVSPAAVHNGPVLSALLRKVTVDLPIDVLAETEAGAVIVDGRPQRRLAFLRREAPRLDRGESAVPLALLGADPMLLGRGPSAYEFLVLLGDVLFAPLLAVLARGIALEAHGQNTLVVLRDGRPVRILYRDLGGVRVSARRLRQAGFDAPDLDGDLPSDDPRELRTKLAAAAFGTVAGELIAGFARTRGADPARLWRIVAEAIARTGTQDAPHLLRDPLPVKATTAMRLAVDPLDDQWALLDNPMAA